MKSRSKQIIGAATGLLCLAASMLASTASAADCGCIGHMMISGDWLSSDTSSYHSENTKQAPRAATVTILPGETPKVLASAFFEYKAVGQKLGLGKELFDWKVSMPGEWCGIDTDEGRRQKWWVPVKPGWNTITAQANAYRTRDKANLGTVSMTFRFYAYVFELKAVGQWSDPVPGEGTLYINNIVVGKDGSLYFSAYKDRHPKSSDRYKYVLVRYDQSGRLATRYQVSEDGPVDAWAVDEAGRLYAERSSNLIQFDRKGAYIRTVCMFGNSAVIDAEAARLGLADKSNYDYKKRMQRAGNPPSVDASPWSSWGSRAAVGDKIYFRTSASGNKWGGFGCVTLNGQFAMLDQNASAFCGPVNGPRGNIYLLQADTDQSYNGGYLLSYSQSGRLEEKFRMNCNLPSPHAYGFDSAGFYYCGGKAWNPKEQVQTTSEIGMLRWKYVPQGRGKKGYYIDTLTGARSDSRTQHWRPLAHWMYKGVLYMVYPDLIVARAASLHPGAGLETGATLAAGDIAPRPPAADDANKPTGTPAPTVPPGTGATPTPIIPPATPSDEDVPPPDDRPGDEPGNIYSGAQPESIDNDDPSAIPAGAAATGAAAAGVIAAIGAWLTMLGSGTRIRETLDAFKGLFGKQPPPDQQPPPPPMPEPPKHRDGEVNDRDEVWSDEDHGWIGRNLYDQEKARRARIKELNDQALHTPDAGVKEAHDKWLESKKNLERTVVEGRLKLARKLELLDRIAANERENDKFSYYGEVMDNFKNDVKDDMKELANDARWTMTGLAQGFDMGLTNIKDAVADPENWKAVAKGSWNTALRYANPINAASDSAKIIGKTLLVVNAVGRHIVLNPIETAKTVIGYENWKNALDYKKPISERLGCAVMGAVDTTLTFGGTILRGAELAGKSVQGLRQAAEIDRLKDGLELTHAEQARKGAWISGSAEAEANVQKFLKNPNDPELLKVIQSDHRAIQAINNQPESVRSAFNQAMAERNTVADAAAKARLETTLADEGLDLSKHEVRIRCETNPTAKIKAGADRDITYSIYDKDGRWVRDVPADKVRSIHQEEYYKAWNNGQLPANPKEAEDFSRMMRQEHVDNMGAEAYGKNPSDLNTVLRNPSDKLRDSQQVGQAMGYKTGKELGEAEHLRHAGDAKKAEEVAGYGYRQAPKQAENIMERRAAAARDAGHAVKDTPENIKFGIELIRRVEGKVPGVKLSPVEAEKIYQMKYGKSLESVAYEIGDRVEALEKLANTPKASSIASAADMAKLGHIAAVGSAGKGK